MCERTTMFILFIKDGKVVVSLGTSDNLNIVALLHKVQFVKFRNHAQIKQGTPCVLLPCEKGSSVLRYVSQ